MTFKKMIAALMALALLFSFSSCLSLLRWIKKNNNKTTESAVSSVSPETPSRSTDTDNPGDPSVETNAPSQPTSSGGTTDDDHDVLSFTFDETVLTRIEERFGQLDVFLSENDAEKYEEFQNSYDALQDDLDYLGDHSSIYYLLFSLDTSKEENSDKYKELSDLRTEFNFRLMGYYDDIYNSAFKDSFYEEWSEEDIADALILAKLQDEEIISMRKQVTDLETEFNKMDSADKTNYLKESAKIYDQIVHLNMKIAEKMGFDSFADFAYKYYYGRDFTPADARKMYGYVKDYVIPLCNGIYLKLISYKNIKRVLNDYESISEKAVDSKKIADKLAPYYERLGGRTPEAFEIWQKNCYISTNKNARDGAFTVFLDHYEFPFCYYSANYRSVLTYAHEQGHFQAFYISNHSIDSYDVCETQSQGNEWLYLSYYGENFDDEYFKYLAGCALYDNLIQITLSTCCDAFEQYVYAHPELTSEDYDRVFIEQAQAIGAYEFLDDMMSIQPEDYWHYAVVDSSMYYLSYAVSNVPSIELLVIAEEEGFDRAAEIYRSLLDIEQDAGFEETLEAAGIDSPFKEEVYKRLYKYFFY